MNSATDGASGCGPSREAGQIDLHIAIGRAVAEKTLRNVKARSAWGTKAAPHAAEALLAYTGMEREYLIEEIVAGLRERLRRQRPLWPASVELTTGEMTMAKPRPKTKPRPRPSY